MTLPIQATQVLRDGRWETTFEIGDLTQGEASNLSYRAAIGHIVITKQKEDIHD